MIGFAMSMILFRELFSERVIKPFLSHLCEPLLVQCCSGSPCGLITLGCWFGAARFTKAPGNRLTKTRLPRRISDF